MLCLRCIDAPQVLVGYLDFGVGVVEMTAYDAAGKPLLAIQNTIAGGYEFLAVATTDGSALIQGLLVARRDTRERWAVKSVGLVVSSYEQGCCV